MSALQLLQQMGSSGKKTLSFQTSTDSTGSGGTSVTFTAQAIGVAQSDRRVIVTVASGAGTITGVTVGGIAASAAATLTTGGIVSSIWMALVPTGTTADIVASGTGIGRTGIGVWSCIGVQTNTSFASGTSSADPGTATLATTVGGFCICLAAEDKLTSLTWTNATERFDTQTGAALTYSGADAVTTGANISPSGDFLDGSGNKASVFATW